MFDDMNRAYASEIANRRNHDGSISPFHLIRPVACLCRRIGSQTDVQSQTEKCANRYSPSTVEHAEPLVAPPKST
jgi:hypothetical protein